MTREAKIAVIKYGGAAMQTPALIQSTMEDIAHLKTLGIHPVIVHGGGREISKMCQKIGIAPVFIQGLRVTDRETLEIAQMVLIGKINKELVAELNRQGANAVGFSGHDGHLMLARQIDPNLGFVGAVEQVNSEILEIVIARGFIPVIAPIAASRAVESYNVNADSAAASIAIALKADHLILLTDVAGILQDPNDSTTKISTIKSSKIDALIQDGTLTGGMLPKIEGALAATRGGVGQVHILDGRVPSCLLLHFKCSKSQGTTIHV